MRLCSSSRLLLVSFLIGGPNFLHAQEAPANLPTAQRLPVASASDQHLIPLSVLVTDGTGRAIPSLTKDNFSVTEDGQRQAILNVWRNDAPCSIGILLDLSGSMEKHLPQERAAVLQFLRASNPNDEFFLLTFSDHADLLVDFTSSQDQIAAKLDNLQIGHRTALYDALSEALGKLRQASRPRRVLLVISDGNDNVGHHSDAEIRTEFRKLQVQMNGIAFDDSRASVEEQSGLHSFTQLTTDSGGRFLLLDDPTQAGVAGAAMAAGLRLGYVLSYSSTNRKADGQWRKVKVKVSPPPGIGHLSIYAPNEYYAPLQ